MTKYAVLVHGKDGSPDSGWLPWTKRELEAHGYHCEAPAFPPQDDSKLADWFPVFNHLKQACKPNHQDNDRSKPKPLMFSTSLYLVQHIVE